MNVRPKNYLPMRCKSKNCLNDAAKGRTVCYKCKSRKFRESLPLQATFNELRNNANRREIEFSITLAEWGKFCNKTNYLNLRGVMAKDMTVDRRDATKGYTYSNIQMLTKSDNVLKKKADAHAILKAKYKIKPKGKDDPF